jgi:muramoyltetrapeptide carboxypeptidase
MILPKFLNKGDVVRLVSPAGVIDSILVEQAGACIESWGLKVIYGAHAKGVYGRYSGTANERLSDLQEALDDENCSAIFCTRGGYGTIQILDKLDLTKFETNPKWVIGYSDITMLHSLLSKTGYVSIHGGMARAFSESLDKPSEPVNLLKDMLFGKLPEYCIKSHKLNKHGKCSGQLWGGNLAILYSLRGTKFDYIPEGSILFIEDTGEKPYVIERMIYNLKLGGVFEKISGMIIGKFSDYEEDPLMKKSVYEIISDVLSEYNIPVCYDFPVGHVDLNLPLMPGALVELDVKKGFSELKYINSGI